MAGRKPGEDGPKPPKKGFLDKLREKVSAQLARWLHENALPRQDAIAVEAGCGTAEGSSALKAFKAVRLAVALDYNIERLKEAKARDPGLCIVRGDMFRLPFKPGSVDLVWNHSTMEHIHDKRRTIHEMVHTAKDGGKIFIGVPYARGPFNWLSWIPSSKFQKRMGSLFAEQALGVDIEGTGVVLEQFTLYHHKMFLGCLAKKAGQQ
jgi:SAM-dependent methyltransferase